MLEMFRSGAESMMPRTAPKPAAVNRAAPRSAQKNRALAKASTRKLLYFSPLEAPAFKARVIAFFPKFK